MLYGFRADIAPINSSLFIRFEIGSSFYPILASGSEFNPRNIQYIHPVTFFAFLELEQK